ncbi:deoxycytidylate deaminase [Paenibacillus mucilaginosus]|uniref:CMP/dCMP deaminase, zinc-binding protein n=3 Tax=Paenibacillus mucilaginosus TaxID=61624 RepID=H6NIJ4_9BACL|nr:cytidine/deoxycytidylate deaminase family protein [Paenibacillus mucilaginosus]AEI42704.1 CMP/dCMP deaminase, zinc-binding protein [Paenibacillus mucilaginosus KNP414]AFC32305.1 CMP/dCMP deaminase, zinc-binding protein [Paenibacillus mucilaginosus 3016]AFH64611.1 CMP deaminase [Paenibacillus mucilaginosus K02]MCG7217051.1 cytidine/deoxycytidylate deaminase family protein [Paenibacillus mucilaginosus]WDM26087.1 cytidine/deoxycytidylate deaminase family protein [Paenibacillus mucilaginosus]
MTRKDWDTYFMDIAYMASTRSQCGRRHVGAVLVQGKKLLGTAYNGAPMGVPDCSEAGCMLVEEFELVNADGGEQVVKKQRCIRTIHAEQNLLLFTDREDREGSVVYVTDQPCWTCANMLANSGIAEIVYHRPYPKDAAKVRGLMDSRGMRFRMLEQYEPPAGTLTEVHN